MPPSSAGSAATLPRCRCDELPRIEVRYNLRHDVAVPPPSAGKPSLLRLGYSVVAGLVNGVLRRRTARSKLRVLDDLEGVLRPGVATVVISAPGSGSTTLLRLISGRTKPNEGDWLRYNGWTRQHVVDSGVNLSRLASFCSDRDEHEPLLTTEETFSFVSRAIAAVRTQFGHHVWLPLHNHHNNHGQQQSQQQAQCSYCHPPAPNFIIGKLGLDEARTTVRRCLMYPAAVFVRSPTPYLLAAAPKRAVHRQQHDSRH